jgi:hypothetical protein
MATDAGARTSVDGRRDALLGMRPRLDYNADERRFSVFVRQRLNELLQGERNDLLLLRLYPGAPERLGVMGTPGSIDRSALRLPVVRRLLEDTLLFLHADAQAGPTEQSVTPRGWFVERRTLPTKYPHIILEREDVFDSDGECARSTWSAQRVQNQRAQTQINRLLDVANLGFEVAGQFLKP